MMSNSDLTFLRNNAGRIQSSKKRLRTNECLKNKFNHSGVF